MNTDHWPSVREAAAQVQAGSVLADGFARPALQRIADTDKELGAFVCTLDADADTGSALPLGGPLAGVPVAVKDIFDTRDLPTAYGSPIYPPEPSTTDAAIVSVLRSAGAIIIGKSTTTEFAFLQPTATRNPRAPGRTPGRSAAGSAAAVAAGLVPLAVGTQTAGSIIRPASYCGMVGYKPSFGWLPTAGLKCFSWSLDTVGLFARNVADVAVFAQALNGRALALDGTQRDAPWAVGMPAHYPWDVLSPSAAQALAKGQKASGKSEVSTCACDFPPIAQAAFDAHATIQGYEAWRSLRWEFEQHADALSAQLRDYLRGVSSITARDYEATLQLATFARSEVAAWFIGFDVLMTPSAPDVALPGFDSTGPSTFNRLWTLLGMPCINVPGAPGEGGTPWACN